MARLMATHPHMPELTPALPIPPEPLPLLNPYPLWIPLSTLPPRFPNEPTPSIATPEPPSFPQGNNIVTTLHQLNTAGKGMTDKVLLEWALDVLCSPEDWRWLWSPEPTITPSPSPTLNHPPPLWYGASSANPLNMSVPSAQNTYAPSVGLLLLVTPNEPASCIPVPSVESLVMWIPVAQLQLQLAPLLSLPEWATLEGFESAPQGYEGGNVTVEGAPTSFSPFPPVDCTLLSHFVMV